MHSSTEQGKFRDLFGCSFFAYSSMLPAYSLASLLVVVFGSFLLLAMGAALLTVEAFCIQVENASDHLHEL